LTRPIRVTETRHTGLIKEEFSALNPTLPANDLVGQLWAFLRRMTMPLALPDYELLDSLPNMYFHNLWVES